MMFEILQFTIHQLSLLAGEKIMGRLIRFFFLIDILIT
jgi:hypothetical protein